LQSAPDHHSLRLDALHRGQDQYCCVENTQGSFDLGDEIGMPGGVDEVDGQVTKCKRGHGGADGDPAPTLQFQRVGAGGAGVHAAQRLDHAGLEEQAFSQAGLAGVNMRDDSKI